MLPCDHLFLFRRSFRMSFRCSDLLMLLCRIVSRKLSSVYAKRLCVFVRMCVNSISKSSYFLEYTRPKPKKVDRSSYIIKDLSISDIRVVCHLYLHIIILFHFVIFTTHIPSLPTIIVFGITTVTYNISSFTDIL